MWLPEVAFQDLSKIIHGPVSQRGKKVGRPSRGHSPDPTQTPTLAGERGSAAGQGGRPKLLTGPTEECTEAGQKSTGPFLF